MPLISEFIIAFDRWEKVGGMLNKLIKNVLKVKKIGKNDGETGNIARGIV